MFSGRGEVLGVIQVAMLAGQPYTMLRDVAFTHPTMNEGLKLLFGSALRLAEVRMDGSHSSELVPQSLENLGR
jgi:hypothetical protein